MSAADDSGWRRACVVWQWLNGELSWRPYSAAVVQLLERASTRRLNCVLLGDADPLLADVSVNITTARQLYKHSECEIEVGRCLYGADSAPARGVAWQWQPVSGSSADHLWHGYNMQVQCALEQVHTHMLASADNGVVGGEGEGAGVWRVHLAVLDSRLNGVVDLSTMSETCDGQVRVVRRQQQTPYPLVKVSRHQFVYTPPSVDEIMRASILAARRDKKVRDKQQHQSCTSVRRRTLIKRLCRLSSRLTLSSNTGRSSSDSASRDNTSPANSPANSPAVSSSPAHLSSSTCSMLDRRRLSVATVSTYVSHGSDVDGVVNGVVNGGVVNGGVSGDVMSGDVVSGGVSGGVVRCLLDTSLNDHCRASYSNTHIQQNARFSRDRRRCSGFTAHNNPAATVQSVEATFEQLLLLHTVVVAVAPPGGVAVNYCCVCASETQPPATILQLCSCKHQVHLNCARALFSANNQSGYLQCACCGAVHGCMIGTQPASCKMSTRILPLSLPGFNCNTIEICFTVCAGGSRALRDENSGRYFTPPTSPHVTYLPHTAQGLQMDRDRRIKSAWDVFATSASAATPFSRAATTTATAGDERSRGQIISSSSCSTTAASADVLAGSDSAISAGSSDEEREICRIFDYLDEHDEPDNTGSHHSTQHHHHRHQHHHPTRFHHQEVLGGGGGAPASRRTRHQTVTTCGRAAGKSVRDKPAELKHIEQHLSMKKTLRKKMMRDLRQAFVDDPSEFCGDQSRLSGEQRHLIDINKLHIAGDRTRASERGGGIGGEHNFLNMLRQNDTSPDSGHDSPVLETTPYTSVRHKQQPSQPQASPPAVKEKISFWKRLTGATGHGAGKKSK